MARCSRDPVHFIRHFCQIKLEGEDGGGWVPFDLWPAQVDVVRAMHAERQIIFLKSRQIGATWLAVAYALWLILFRHGSTVLMFSKRDDEAVDMLDERLKGMFYHLPEWMRPMKFMRAAAGTERSLDGKHAWTLSNGSRAKAFPTTGGRSYTASLCIVDEAAYIPSLARLMDAVEPTINDGGKIIVLSTVNKSEPMSAFKKLYRSAMSGENGYHPLFLPWNARPTRTQEWYEEKRAAKFAETGADDAMREMYPATVEEALAPASLDKRIPYPWLMACYEPREPLTPQELLARGISLEIPQAEGLFPPV